MCVEKTGIEALIKLREEGNIPKLKNIVSYDEVTESQIERAKAVDVRLITYKDVIEEGKKYVGDV